MHEELVAIAPRELTFHGLGFVGAMKRSLGARLIVRHRCGRLSLCVGTRPMPNDLRIMLSYGQIGLSIGLIKTI